jgi:hypothetical protein
MSYFSNGMRIRIIPSKDGETVFATAFLDGKLFAHAVRHIRTDGDSNLRYFNFLDDRHYIADFL